MKTIVAHKMPKLPFPICKLMAVILNFLLISLLFFKSIVKYEFLVPKYYRLEVLVTIVAPQDQLYIETNLAFCSFTQFAQYAHKKKLPKVAAAATKLNLLIYPPRIQFHQKTLYLTP